jgi:uncharacterized protein (TIGR02265 family)
MAGNPPSSRGAPSVLPGAPASSPGSGGPPASTRAPLSNRGGSIKGSVIASRLAFVREKKGEPGMAAVLARLSESDQRVVGVTVLPFGWYAFDVYSRLDTAIAEAMGQGESIFRVLGARSATDNLGADHKRYIREGDPHWLLKQASSIYKLYYDTGERTYERMTDRKATLRTQGSLMYSPADCLTVIGWHEKAIELCGGSAIRVTETLCRARGAKLCEYVCEWE